MPGSPQRALRIAFTSCFSTEVFSARQPVWEFIAAQQPDVLVLLGDSIYIDGPWPYGPMGSPVHPGELSAHDFAVHVHSLYARQLAVPEFRNLISRGDLEVHAVWDDHDFLWNDALQPNLQLHQQHAVYSSNLFQCWRNTLLHGVPFPLSVQDPRVSHLTRGHASQEAYDRAMPGYRHVELDAGRVVLHLPDGRSWRTQKTLLGERQRAEIAKRIAQTPKALHLLASGSTLNSHPPHSWRNYVPGMAWLVGMIHGQRFSQWSTYPADYAWLQGVAAKYDLIVLSGDIHKNARPVPIACGARQLREFTSSGAAVDFAQFLGDRHPFLYAGNFGMLTLAPGAPARVEYFSKGVREGSISDQHA